jgi:hypothetical protein
LTIAVILILGVIWAVVLIPPILKARAGRPRNDSVGDFHYRLRMLGQTNGTHRDRPARLSLSRPAFAPHRGSGRQSPRQKRRQDVLLVMLGVCAATLFLALLSRMTVLLVVHLACDALLAAYLYLLVRHKQRATEQRSKVRFLNTAYRSSAPYLAGYPASDGTSESTGPRLVPVRQSASR